MSLDQNRRDDGEFDGTPSARDNRSRESLTPQKAAATSLADITRDFKLKEEGDAAARRALNSLAVTSSMVSALIEHPGPNSDHQSMVQATRTMLRCADETTQSLVENLGLKGLSWAPYRVMRLVSSAVSDRWMSTARGGNPSADVTDFLPVWQEIALHTFPEMIIEAPAPEAAAALRIALLDAMQPVMQEVAIFDMFHNDKEAATHARDVILLGAHRALADLTIEVMSDRSKSMLMQTLLRNGGRIYASAWRRHAEDTIEQIQSMDKQAQTALLEANSSGLPLGPIDESFQSSFLKLIEMVQYLSAPRMPQLVSGQDDSRPDIYSDESGGEAPAAPINASAAAA